MDYITIADKTTILNLSIPEPNTGCWLWVGFVHTRDGYGQINVPRKDGTFDPRTHKLRMTTVGAHRVAYEAFKGPIPADLELDHLCRVRCCVNPDHLEPVTRRVNVERGISPMGKNAVKTHCPEGHPLSGDNLLIYTRLYQHGRIGHSRDCRLCRQRTRRAYHERKQLDKQFNSRH